jgi:hypothetical protein
MLTQSRQLPLFISILIPPPYSSASHCKYLASKLLKGPSSNEVTSFGDKYTVPEDDEEPSMGNNDPTRESWRHVLAWNVCSRARVVNISRSRRALRSAGPSEGSMDKDESCRVFAFTLVNFPVNADIPLERR